MNSLRARLAVTIAALALLTVVAVTVAVATTTERAFDQTIAEQRAARQVIVEVLNEAAIESNSWVELTQPAEELAERLGVRIVLTDTDGRRLVDTGAGDLPPLEGVIDPFGVFAEFAEDVAFDEQEFGKALLECFDTRGVPYELVGDEVFLEDDFDDDIFDEELFGDDAFDDVVDLCYGEAARAAELDSTVKEPALLFLGFESRPSIPWLAIGLIALSAVLVAALVATPLSVLVSRPLGALAAAARSIRGGDLTVRVATDAPSEVADLATSFNDMAEELSRADARRKQLTADVAHELRSPLTNVLGHLDAIEDGIVEPSPEQIRVITAEAVRLARLVDDLQTMAALDEHTLSLDVVEADPANVVNAAIEARRARSVDAGVTLSTSGWSAPVLLDPLRVEQIVGNLIDNALEHTPPGGRVTATIADRADAVTIAVADSGPGIDPELLPFVFDRLRRADRARSPDQAGRGLGLAIARGLAQLHGGDLAAANDTDGGAVFELTLPRSG